MDIASQNIFDCTTTGLIARDLKINIVAIHEVMKPMKCKDCEASFSGRAHLKIHIALVHEGKIHSNEAIVTPTFNQNRF